MSISNNRALQIETSLANSVVDTLKVCPSGIDLFLFLEKDKFIHFHFDNTDFNIDAVDGKNQLHDGPIVLFQNGESSGEVKIPSIDLTSKTFKVMRNEFTELQNCNVPNTKQFNIDNDFLYDHPPPPPPTHLQCHYAQPTKCCHG